MKRENKQDFDELDEEFEEDYEEGGFSVRSVLAVLAAVLCVLGLCAALYFLIFRVYRISTENLPFLNFRRVFKRGVYNSQTLPPRRRAPGHRISRFPARRAHLGAVPPPQSVIQ